MEERSGRLLGGDSRRFGQKREREDIWHGYGRVTSGHRRGSGKIHLSAEVDQVHGGVARNETKLVEAEVGQALPDLVFLGRHSAFIQWTLRSCRKICGRGGWGE